MSVQYNRQWCLRFGTLIYRHCVFICICAFVKWRKWWRIECNWVSELQKLNVGQRDEEDQHKRKRSLLVGCHRLFVVWYRCSTVWWCISFLLSLSLSFSHSKASANTLLMCIVFVGFTYNATCSHSHKHNWSNDYNSRLMFLFVCVHVLLCM